jgi:hypothetical protein
MRVGIRRSLSCIMAELALIRFRHYGAFSSKVRAHGWQYVISNTREKMIGQGCVMAHNRDGLASDRAVGVIRTSQVGVLFGLNILNSDAPATTLSVGKQAIVSNARIKVYTKKRFGVSVSVQMTTSDGKKREDKIRKEIKRNETKQKRREEHKRKSLCTTSNSYNPESICGT